MACKPQAGARHDARERGSGGVSLDELRQMCDAPSDAFSAGAWCEAANKLLAICDDRRAARRETRRNRGLL